MTFREKLKQKHPEEVNDMYAGGCFNCPYDYGYENRSDGMCIGAETFSEEKCRACWDREMPADADAEEQEQHDLEINAEIIRGYCVEYDGINCKLCPAYCVCRSKYPDGPWKFRTGYTVSAAKQRAMLDAFEAALPPEEEEAPTVRLPDTVTVKIGPEEPVSDEPQHLASELRQHAHDAVDHPAHYTAGGIECIDAITAALECHGNPVAAFLTGQVLKYMWRWPMKGGREDLRKARWYLDRLLDETEGN